MTPIPLARLDRLDEDQALAFGEPTHGDEPVGCQRRLRVERCLALRARVTRRSGPTRRGRNDHYTAARPQHASQFAGHGGAIVRLQLCEEPLGIVDDGDVH